MSKPSLLVWCEKCQGWVSEPYHSHANDVDRVGLTWGTCRPVRLPWAIAEDEVDFTPVQVSKILG